MKIFNRIRKSAWQLRNYMRGYYDWANLSYSQTGEDVIARAIFDRLSIHRPRYLDIGANDPFYLSNTAAFYLSGSRGVIVEPNASLIHKFAKYRRKDAIVNAGIGSGDQRFATFYEISPNVLSTFDPDAAAAFVQAGHKIVREQNISIIGINDLLAEHFSVDALNLLSLDIEGGEANVLRNMDFSKFRPEVMIVETWRSHLGAFDLDISRILIENGYVSFVKTKPNELFLEQGSARKL